MAKIGELLVAAGQLTQDGLEEALDWQVLYGGRLGTNLLELRHVEEADLARALGKQFGAEVAWGELVPDPALVAAMPAHVANRNEMVPWKLEKRRLKVLCTEIRLAELDQLGYKVGRPCIPVIAPEFRVVQLLRAHYQAQRQMRALDFGIVPEEGREERRRKKQQAEKGPERDQGPELIDETAFNEIYNQVIAGRPAQPAQSNLPPPAQTDPSPQPVAGPPANAARPPQATAAQAPRAPLPALDASRGHAAREAAPDGPPPARRDDPASSWQSSGRAPRSPPVLERISPPAAFANAVAGAPSGDAAAPAPPAAQPRRGGQAPIEALPEEAILEPLPEGAIEGEAALQEAQLESEPPLPVVNWDEVPAPPAPAVDESPLDFRQALELLKGVTDRDSIAHIVLRASRSKAARALLLQVQGGVALGWDGIGEGFSAGNVRSVAIPLGAQSAFQLVVKTRSHYMGPLQKTPLNIRFLATLGKKIPLSSLILPILHKGRVSYLLYLDNGHREQAPTDVGEMLILSQRIAQTVEALVERKRKAARG